MVSEGYGAQKYRGLCPHTPVLWQQVLGSLLGVTAGRSGKAISFEAGFIALFRTYNDKVCNL